MSDCIFCKIAAGKIPCAKVLEDEACLAFMDIGPLAEGHVLLIPKAHAEQLDDMEAAGAGAMLKHLPALVSAVKAATGCAGVNVLQNNGPAAHQEVMHVHVHIIPRNIGDAFHFNWPAGQYPQGRAGQLADAIKANLP
ncbi:MAG: HIT family protein [Planctomycetaceae bacterium]|nr:HIT family protein [Planctomycetaceae bacterium]